MRRGFHGTQRPTSASSAICARSFARCTRGSSRPSRVTTKPGTRWRTLDGASTACSRRQERCPRTSGKRCSWASCGARSLHSNRPRSGRWSKPAPATATGPDRAHASLSRVRGIVDGLFEFARAGAAPEAGARTEVRAVATGLVEELRPFAAQRQAILRIDDLPDCAVACSPGVLLSVLGNLLRNGLKYLGKAETRQVVLRARRRRGRVLFEVEDTGPGIPAQLGTRIFEPYIRGPDTGAPGLGLGLATVKRLVESHRGSLGVRAGARGGALFWFELDEASAADDASQPEHLRTA